MNPNQYFFLGSEIGSFPIDATNGSGFPFRYVAGDTLSSEVPLGQIGSWWWRVKKWSLTATSQLDTPAGTYLLGAGNFTPPTHPSSEEELRDGAFGRANTITGTFNGSPDPGNSGVDFNPFSGNQLFQDDTDKAKFLPRIAVTGGLNTGATNRVLLGTAGTGVIPVTVDGYALNVDYLFDNPLSDSTFSVGTISIDPAEYWTWGGIYNSSTGAVNPGHSIYERG